MNLRRILTGVSPVLAAVAIAACGGSGGGGNGGGGSGPAAADPATRVPASAVVYASVSVKPGADTSAALQHIVDTFGGHGTFNRLLNQLKQSFAEGHSGLTYAKDVEPWLGQRVGIALTRWPANFNSNSSNQDVVLVFPTANPAAARRALPALRKNQVSGGLTATVSGNYVLIGGKAAVSAAEAVTSGHSLASSSNYQASVKKLHSGVLATAYIKPRSLEPLINRAMSNSPAGSLPSPVASELARSFQMVPADASGVAGVTVTNKTVALDITATGIKSLSSNTSFNDVGSLPADSWLAIATPGVSESSVHRALTSMTQTATAGGQTTAQQAQAIARIIGQLAPHGIGGVQASAAGQFTGGMPPKIGISLDLKGAQTAHNSASMLFNFLQAGGAHVLGNQSAFTMPLNSSDTLSVATAGSNLVATIGYPHTAAFASPGSKLSGNATYEHAVAQLPSGSEVPLYVNLGQLASDLPVTAFTNPSDRQTLSKFSYVIAGVNTSDSEVSIVTGLH